MSAFAPDAYWYVAAGDGPSYREAGASNVIESGPLCASRNRALDDAFAEKRACVQLSDDLRGIKFAGRRGEADIDLSTAISFMEKACAASGAYLAGAAPTSNAFYTDAERRPVRTAHFIVGDFIYVRPTPLRFWEELLLKEDYDYTAQHLREYGCVARCDVILAAFAHRSNAGGAVSYRTSELERTSIAQLEARWPGVFRPNPRRPDEILMEGAAAIGRR